MIGLEKGRLHGHRHLGYARRTRAGSSVSGNVRQVLALHGGAEAYADVLEALARGEDHSERIRLLEMLCHHLNYIAPNGRSFGIRCGTQADFGFWRAAGRSIANGSFEA